MSNKKIVDMNTRNKGIVSKSNKRDGLKNYITKGMLIVQVLYSTIFLLLIQSNIAYATTDYAKKGATWILDQFFWIIIVVAIVTISMMAVKRQLTGAIITLLVTAVLLVIIKNPTIIEDIGKTLKSTLGL